VSTKGVLGIAAHFEKMLYDNAQLARVYLYAWQVTGGPFYRTITEETLDYVVREMTFPGEGFYSIQDANSEGEVGKFFVWTPDEVRAVLGDRASRFIQVYEMTERGNASTGSAHGFEGKNILEVVGSVEERKPLAGRAASCLSSVRNARILDATTRCSRRGTGSCWPPSPRPHGRWSEKITARWRCATSISL
jgi:uncharacterized protein YyaL (SSP411 family)